MHTLYIFPEKGNCIGLEYHIILSKIHIIVIIKTKIIDQNKSCSNSVDQSLYRSMIGSLLYLTASRPDIAFVVGVCARYQAEPKVSHINQVKRIMKYVNGTCEYGMLYSHGCEPILTGYCDADWAGSADDRKST